MILFIICSILFFKLFMDYTHGKCQSKVRLDGKTVIITGANSGIGYETTRDLARRGARIIMACRNTAEGLLKKNEIIQETANRNIEVMHLDISSLESIRTFANQIIKTEKQLDILVNNAGIRSTTDVNSENIQLCLITNLFGPFLLTLLLIDLMKKATSARVVFVSSGMAIFGSSVNFNTMSDKGEFPDKVFSIYSISKYGLILVSNELARRLKNTNITVNSLHPGLIRTKMINKSTITTFLLKFIKSFTKSPEQGAQTQIHLCVDENIKTVTGKFFIDCAEFNVFSSNKDLENTSVLWRKCEEIVKLTENESKI